MASHTFDLRSEAELKIWHKIDKLSEPPRHSQIAVFSGVPNYGMMESPMRDIMKELGILGINFCSLHDRSLRKQAVNRFLQERPDLVQGGNKPQALKPQWWDEEVTYGLEPLVIKISRSCKRKNVDELAKPNNEVQDKSTISQNATNSLSSRNHGSSSDMDYSLDSSASRKISSSSEHYRPGLNNLPSRPENARLITPSDLVQPAIQAPTSIGNPGDVKIAICYLYYFDGTMVDYFPLDLCLNEASSGATPNSNAAADIQRLDFKKFQEFSNECLGRSSEDCKIFWDTPNEGRKVVQSRMSFMAAVQWQLNASSGVKFYVSP